MYLSNNICCLTEVCTLCDVGFRQEVIDKTGTDVVAPENPRIRYDSKERQDQQDRQRQQKTQ